MRFLVFVLCLIPISLLVSALLSQRDASDVPRMPEDPWKPLAAPPCSKNFLSLCPQSLDSILLLDFLNGTKLSRKKEEQGSPHANVTWGKGVFGFVAPAKLPIRYVVVEKDFCHVSDVQVIIYVHTAPKNSQRRDVIRSTWGNPQWYPMLRHKVIFIVGQLDDAGIQKRLKEESVRYHDLVVADFVDSYKNLSFKALTAMHWIREYCGGAKFIAKTDDDVFVNIFALDRFLNHVVEDPNQGANESQPTKGSERELGANGTSTLLSALKGLSARRSAKPEIQCLVWEGMSVLRDKKSKWYVSPSEYSNRTYPPYCSGNAFLMTWPTAHALLHASTTTPFLWVDDAYLTGVLASAAKVHFVKRNSLYELNGNKFVESLIKGEKVFLHHPQHDPVTTREMWNALLNKEAKDNFLNHTHQS